MDDVFDDDCEANAATSPFACSSTDGVVHSTTAEKWSRGSDGTQDRKGVARV